MIEQGTTNAIVDDGKIAITLHRQVSQFPVGKKPEDFYLMLKTPRYGGNVNREGTRFHFTIVTSEQFDIASFTPKQLRTYLTSQFQEVLELPCVVEKYGRLVPNIELGQLRSRLYDCVAKRFEPVK